EIIGQIYIPMSRELRRYLKEITTQQTNMAWTVPASDRIVTLNHNSDAYKETVETLDKLEDAVEQANDYPDAEDKEQRLAELSAGKRLLSSARVRVAAAVAVLSPLLLWLADKFVGSLIGQIAQTAWQALKVLFGL